MIMIKPIYGDWTEVTREQAKDFVLFLFKNMNGVAPEKQEDYINKNKIKGITVKELLEVQND